MLVAARMSSPLTSRALFDDLGVSISSIVSIVVGRGGVLAVYSAFLDRVGGFLWISTRLSTLLSAIGSGSGLSTAFFLSHGRVLVDLTLRGSPTLGALIDLSGKSSFCPGSS